MHEGSFPLQSIEATEGRFLTSASAGGFYSVPILAAPEESLLLLQGCQSQRFHQLCQDHSGFGSETHEAFMQVQQQQQLAYLLCDAYPWRVQQRPQQASKAQQKARTARRAAAALVCGAVAGTALNGRKAPSAGVRPHKACLKTIQRLKPRVYQLAKGHILNFCCGSGLAAADGKNQDHKLFDEAFITVRSAAEFYILMHAHTATAMQRNKYIRDHCKWSHR